MNQSTFNPSADNADLMLADFYVGSVEPVESDIKDKSTGTATISYSGTKPTIKVGGSTKTFSVAFDTEGTTVAQWLVCDENDDISDDANYTIERDGESLKVRVAQNYNLIGTILTVQAVGSDGSIAKVSVEVI